MDIKPSFDIYRDIANRCAGDIYIGVVGPVRTGKSTFIKRFMDLLVLPNIENIHNKERARDELPQSGSGKTIMTTEPKFIPNEAVEIALEDAAKFKVRLIDCVGYLVPNALGHMDGNNPRMVSTPWFDEKIPFEEAAEMGTKKVIKEHSTIGIVITTDGSISEIERENYTDAEARVVNELKAINKPFVMILNSTRPHDEKTVSLRDELSDTYGIPVISLNCAQLREEDINNIIEKILLEFPVKEVRFNLPKWLEPLPLNHWLKQSIIASVKEIARHMHKIKDIKAHISSLEANEHIKKTFIEQIHLGQGISDIEINLDQSLFYTILSETTGMDILSESQLISTIKVLSDAKKEYDKIKEALEEVRFKGYGIVNPSIEETIISKPEITKHGGRYGVKIKAQAPSLHIIQANIETEISPIVGSEQESLDLVNYFNQEMDSAPERIWELNMFGKSMHSMVKDGLQNKLYRMPEDAQGKLQSSLEKIINEGRGGLICILL